MKFINLALATALLQLLVSCAPPQTDALASTIQRAERGNAHAQTTLGRAYRDGEGAPQDYAQAASWFRKAAEQGDAYAQLLLAWAYRDGEGVPQDYAQAVNWFHKAAEQGDTFAQKGLSDAYRKGEGVSQDYAQSVYWRSKAAEQGDADAQTALSYSYQRGEGVPQDLVLAYAWQNLGATSRQEQLASARNSVEQASGIQEYTERSSRRDYAASRLESAQSARAALAEKLSPSQLAEAQRLSSRWQKGQSIQREKQ